MSRRAFMAYDIENQIADTEGKTAGKIYEKIIDITSAEIKLLVSAPKLLVSAPGPSKVLEFVSAVLFLDHDGASDYDTNTDLTVQTVTGNKALSGAVSAGNFLHQSADVYTIMAALGTAAGVITDVNDGLELVATGIPATGTSPMKIKIAYRIHDFS